MILRKKKSSSATTVIKDWAHLVRDENGNDLFQWGPRPKGAQELRDKMKADNADFETTKITLQNWYNHDKGVSLYNELAALF